MNVLGMSCRGLHSPDEMAATLEALACARGLAAQLLREQAWLAPALQQAARVQSRRIAEALHGVLMIRGPSLPPQARAPHLGAHAHSCTMPPQRVLEHLKELDRSCQVLQPLAGSAN